MSIITLNGFSQILHTPAGAGYLRSGSYSLHHSDLFSALENPAGLAALSSFAAGIYAEKRYLLKELQYYSAMIGIPTSSGKFGIEAGYFGFSEFNETKMGILYGRSMGSKLDLGAEFYYQGIRIAGYGNTGTLGFEAGAVMHFTDRLHAGIRARNPVGGRFGPGKAEKLPAIYSMGFGFDASEKFYAGAELEKEEGRPVNANVVIQYKFLPFLQTRLGLNSAASGGWMGIGLSWKNWRFDIISAYHPYLGPTPGLLLLYQPHSNQQ